MEKGNGKIIAVVALIVAVVGLSVGFATFAATLTIENTNATMTASNQFTNYVNYKSSVSPTCYAGNSTSSASIVGTYNAGNASGKQWTGVSVPLSMEQKIVTCHATVENLSAYRASLNTISIGGSIVCNSVAASGTDGYATNASTICAGTQVTIAVGSVSKTFKNTDLTALSNINSSGIASNGNAEVTMTIEYTDDVASDGDVSITIPTISLEYKSAAAE